MGFAEAQHWWGRWQLRVLVLGSLSLQCFLTVAAALRKRRIPPWLRLLTWAAYLGSDALAIYALATLFNRSPASPSPGGTTTTTPPPNGLEALWAPVLLLHLGGQDGITAYSIQDNELWTRRLLTAASQVAMAVYVFCKSWPHGGERLLLLAAVVLFFPGILKCLEKPWALRRSSISCMAAMAGGAEQQDVVATTAGGSTIHSLQEFLQEASMVYAAGKVVVTNKDLPYHHHHDLLFVDRPYPYSVRLENLKHVWQHEGGEDKGRRAHLLVSSSLSMAFDRLYTNYYDKGSGSILHQLVLRAVLPVVLTFVAIGLFFAAMRSRGHRDRGATDHDHADLIVSYVLLCGTAALEIISDCVAMACSFGVMSGQPPWPDQAAQCNLIGYMLHNEEHRWLRSLASLLGCHGYLDWLWCTAPGRMTRPPASSSASITELIQTHIADQWTNNSKLDDGDYLRFCDSRGQWTLDNEGCSSSIIASSLQRPFDECVIIWHLATDLCFFSHVYHGSHEKENRRCREISNYMAYLLLVNPEMLMPGARRRIFMVAYYQVREMLVKDDNDPLEDEQDLAKKKVPAGGTEDIARMIIQKVKLKKFTAGSTDLVQDAWVLAEELMDLSKRKKDGGEKMWRVIRGVWVEMLCFSASRCRGYLHAKSLAHGGEYLSYVWLLQAYMGMDTLAHTIQGTKEGDLGAAQPPTIIIGDDHA